ncbi:MAG: TlpA family protein disulfide reductase [Adhaeribacter sp.]
MGTTIKIISDEGHYYMKILLSICLFFIWSITYGQVKVPQAAIGNWLDESNTWQYSFYEDFAIYNSDFWEYEQISIKRNQVEISLKKGPEILNLVLVLPKKRDGFLSISRNQERSTTFKLKKPGFLPYPNAEQKSFKDSSFHPDSVTITGYYRNLKKFTLEAAENQDKGPFSVFVPHYIMGEEIEYLVDFDSLGRFKIKVPVLNTQTIILDKGKLHQPIVVTPGESIFLFADLADYILDEKDLDLTGLEKFMNKPTKLLFMGKEARLHNELTGYKNIDLNFTRSKIASGTSSDMEYHAVMKANYYQRLQHLESYISRQPNLSLRFKEYQYTFEKYRFASNLMQYRYLKRNRPDATFEKGYLDFIEKELKFENEKLFTLTNEYFFFIRDYLNYRFDLSTAYTNGGTGKKEYGLLPVSEQQALLLMANQGLFTKEEIATLMAYDELNNKILPRLRELKLKAGSPKEREIMKPYQGIPEKYWAILNRPNIKRDLESVLSELKLQKYLALRIPQIDSVIKDKTIKECLVSKELYGTVSKRKLPLVSSAYTILQEQVTTPEYKNMVLAVSNYYANINNKEISYPTSIKNTNHLKEAKDADLLFKELVAPYKGKIIYIDFWGTWCGPCLELMPFVAPLKQELGSKDVVFMYFANRSPEKAWKNIIKESGLTGENVVHYRLPDAQQAMIERKFSVRSFPTYLIIGKDGILVKDNAPDPRMKSELISLIDSLLIAK